MTLLVSATEQQGLGACQLWGTGLCTRGQAVSTHRQETGSPRALLEAAACPSPGLLEPEVGPWGPAFPPPPLGHSSTYLLCSSLDVGPRGYNLATGLSLFSGTALQ